DVIDLAQEILRENSAAVARLTCPRGADVWRNLEREGTELLTMDTCVPGLDVGKGLRSLAERKANYPVVVRFLPQDEDRFREAAGPNLNVTLVPEHELEWYYVEIIRVISRHVDGRSTAGPL